MIESVDPDGDLSRLRSLLVEYHAWMDEHAGETYAPERQRDEDIASLRRETESWAWVSIQENEPAGCVLLYGQTEEIAEFKRLWVTPEFRGRGVGRALTRRVVDEARTQGFETLGLTTTPWSDAAQALYESMGFERTGPYPETRLSEEHHDLAIFMQLPLAEA